MVHKNDTGGTYYMRNNYNSEQDALNRDIQAAMMRTNDICAAIGRKYYSDNSQGQVPAEYAQMFADLKATCDQIENMQTRLKFLNGIVVCTSCKAENTVNSSFCAVCGTRLPHTFAQDGALRCQRCGNPVQPGQKFCGVCGNIIEAGPAAPQQGQPAPQGGFAPQGQPGAQGVQAGFAPQGEFAPQNPDARFMPQNQPEAESEPVQSEPVPAEPVQSEMTQPEPVQSEAAQPENEVNVTEAPNTTETQPEAPAVCPQCGAPIKAEDALFCAECGYKIR